MIQSIAGAVLVTIGLVPALLVEAATDSSPSATPANPAPLREDSSDDQPDRMGWWRDARFGMFIHWGVYAVPAGEWDGKTVGGASEWIMQTAKIPMSRYEPLAEQFNPVKYDPARWARIAKDAGCKYVVITSKHHDGFCLWDSKLTDWDIARTPYGKDLLAPLAKACRDEGLKFCTYYSIMDWHSADYSPRRAWNDVAKGKPDFDKFRTYTNGLVSEVIRNLQPSVLWFDGEWEDTWTTADGEALEKLCRELKPDIIINNRVGKARQGMGGLDDPGETKLGDFGTPEQEVPARGLPGVDWETCMTMNDSWGFKQADHGWKSSTQLIRTLIDVASKGGNFLLNVGPTAAGEIPPESVERLAAMGTWMRVNGEAIYGTEAGPFARLPWGRCTQKRVTSTDGTVGARLYLHVFDWPQDGRLVVPGLKNHVREATMFGVSRALSTTRAGDDVVVSVPEKASDPAATVVILDVDGHPDVVPSMIRADKDGVITLDAESADTGAHGPRVETIGGKQNLGFWTNAWGTASWTFVPEARETYRVVMEMSCQPGNEGNGFVVRVGAMELPGKTEATKGWSDFHTVEVGRVGFEQSGPVTVTVQPDKGMKGALMNLRAVRLEPVRK